MMEQEEKKPRCPHHLNRIAREEKEAARAL